MSIKVNNLYQLILQRPADQDFPAEYLDMVPDAIEPMIRNSSEYRALVDQKYNTPALPKHIDYTIIKIDNRSDNILTYYTNVLSQSKRHTMEFFDCSTRNYETFFADRDIKICWDPSYSMYREQPLVGEFGICASQIIALEYMIEHNIPELLVFEDDVILSAKFPQLFANAYDELPPGYDFLADCSVFPNERFTNNIECNILYKDFISKTHLQNAHLGMMLYSLDGAKKLLALLKEHGFFAPIDTMVFHFARNEMLDGYTTYFANKLIEQKDIFGSTIDVHNIRR